MRRNFCERLSFSFIFFYYFWVSLSLGFLFVVAVFFLSGFCLLLFWFLSGCLCLSSGWLFFVLRFLALVCCLPARSLAWGVCLSFPSSGILPGFVDAIFVLTSFNYLFGFSFFGFLLFNGSSPLRGVREAWPHDM